MKHPVTRFVSLLLSLALLGALLPLPGALGAQDFADLSEGAWYAEAVREGTERGLFRGLAQGRFGPEAPVDRAMAVTVLWRLAGSPAAAGTLPFEDVKPSAYYGQALRWALEQGVVRGMDETHFAPRLALSRQELAVMLWRYTQSLGPGEGYAPSLQDEKEREALGAYPDEERVAPFAKEAMAWAAAQEIIQGSRQAGFCWLLPGCGLNRAQLAALLLRFADCLAGEAPRTPRPLPRSMEEPETRMDLWVDGKLLEDCPVWDGEPYLSLRGLAEQTGGRFAAGANLRLTALGHSLCFQPGGGTLSLVDGVPLHLEGHCVRLGEDWYFPARPLLGRLGRQELQDPERNQSFFTDVPTASRIPAGTEVVILRYHCVSDDVWGGEGLFMSPIKLEAQLEAMEELGCSFLSFEDLDRIDQYERPVFLTFDDGYRDNYEELFPILQRHNAKATIFMITRAIGYERYLTEDMIREMDASGLVSFQSHTVTHSDMDEMEPADQEFEAVQSQLDLARITGKAPFVLSFPKARASEASLACVARHYEYSVIADGYAWITGTEPYHIPRFVMPRDMSMEDLLSYFE